MSQNRTVIVASPASNRAKKYETSVSTWGELKGVIADLYTGDGNVEAIVHPGNVTLTRDDASLPTGDFKVFLVPTKNKAGVTPSEAQKLGQEIGAAIAEAASRTTSDEVKQLKDALIETIEDFFDVDLSDDCPECDEALEQAKAYLR